MPIITVEHLSKHFKVHKRRAGFWGNLSSTVSRKHDIIKAVDDVNFTLERGELVGYIGANGAGEINNHQDADRDPCADFGTY